MDRWDNLLERGANFVTIMGVLIALGALFISWGDFQKRPIKIEISSPVSGSTLKGDITIRGSVSGRPFDDYKVYSDQELIGETLPSIIDTTNYSNGQHSLKIKVYHNNQSINSRVANFIIDNKPPNFEVIVNDQHGNRVAAEGIIKGKMQIKISELSKGEKVVKKTIDKTKELVSKSYNTTKLEEGRHFISVEAEDSIGNRSTENFPFLVNNKPIKIESLDVSSEGYMRGKISLEPEIFNLSSKGDFKWLVDDQIVSRGKNLRWDTDNAQDSLHNLKLIVTNRVTNVTVDKQTKVHIDNTNPNIDLPEVLAKSKEKPLIFNKLKKLSLEAETSKDAHLLCEVNGKPYSKEILDLSEYPTDENISVEFIAKDKAGNKTSVLREIDPRPSTPSEWINIRTTRFLQSINTSKTARAFALFTAIALSYQAIQNAL